MHKCVERFERGRQGGLVARGVVLGGIAHECAERFKDRLMILLRTIHYAFEGINAPDPQNHIVAAKLFEP